MPSSHNCEAPIVGRVEYSLMDIDDEGFVTLMDEGGNNREDLTLPSGTEDSEKLAKEIRDTFEDDSQERNIAVTVMKVRNAGTLSENQAPMPKNASCNDMDLCVDRP